MSDSAIDAAILQELGTRQYKVARVVGNVAEAAQVSHEAVAARIAALVSAGKLRAFGNIENWRHSEVSVK